jgi:hypothetical protein
VDTTDAARIGAGTGVLRSTGSDGDNVEPGFLIGREMDVAHDEPGADRPDAIVGLRPELRAIIEIEIQWFVGHSNTSNLTPHPLP